VPVASLGKFDLAAAAGEVVNFLGAPAPAPALRGAPAPFTPNGAASAAFAAAHAAPAAPAACLEVAAQVEIDSKL